MMDPKPDAEAQRGRSTILACTRRGRRRGRRPARAVERVALVLEGLQVRDVSAVGGGDELREERAARDDDGAPVGSGLPPALVRDVQPEREQETHRGSEDHEHLAAAREEEAATVRFARAECHPHTNQRECLGSITLSESPRRLER